MIKNKPSKSYVIENADTGGYLSDKVNFTFGDEPVLLTYTQVQRMCGLIQRKHQFKISLQIKLIDNYKSKGVVEFMGCESTKKRFEKMMIYAKSL